MFTQQQQSNRGRATIAALAAVCTMIAFAVTDGPIRQPGTVLDFQKISQTEGGFPGDLDYDDLFGHGVAALGDLDGDGVTDAAVGVFGDDDGGFNTGAVWILFLNADGTVKGAQKISDTQGGLMGDLETNAVFGAQLDGIGDLDGDTIPDIVVGNYGDDDGGHDKGAVWVIFLNTDGTVKAEQKISDTQGGFGGALDPNDQFGHDAAGIGDLDGDGVTDLAVGCWLDDDGGPDRGAVWVLFMNADGTVKAEQKISDTQGGFAGSLDDGDQFGTSVAALGDLDGDGIQDLAVGAYADDDGGSACGAVWILFMNADGTVAGSQKVSSLFGGFGGQLDPDDWFGLDVAGPGDLDADGMPDVVAGARMDDDGGLNRGAVWILFMNHDGTVAAEQKISDTEGNFEGILDDSDCFGVSVASLGDLDGDGGAELMVGAHADDDGDIGAGAVWVLFLEPGVIAAHLDIKPGSCPNPLNRRSKGVLPTALVGTPDFPVDEVDQSTLLLSRADGIGGFVSPLDGYHAPGIVFDDVATPFEGEPCDCHDLDGDGIVDLVMKFDVPELVEMLELGDLPVHTFVELRVSGQLLDGTMFEAFDCVRLVGGH